MQRTSSNTAVGVETLTAPTIVTFETGGGFSVKANLVRLAPQCVAFEVYGPEAVVCLSETLNNFQIHTDTHPVYSGRALVTSILNSGTASVCEVALSESWIGFEPTEQSNPTRISSVGFDAFLKHWQSFYRIDRDYKVAVADLQTFLSALRLWLERVELNFQSAHAVDRAKLELEIAQGLCRRVTPSLSSMFERFEAVANKIEPDLQAVHRTFGQRQLHPHLLCAPFIYRTYAKPLGYAGDYEMMNMIIRNGLEGGSLYAKLVNAYLLDQAPAHAVRNRVKFLCEKIRGETLRCIREGHKARIYSIACGPAREAEDFIRESPLADDVEFRLLDFNEETLKYTSSRLDQAKKEHNRGTPVKIIKNSVQSLLKASAKDQASEKKFDLIYCSGLYDYLNDRIIKALNTYLYDLLNPGGLLVVGNFATNNPIQKIMEHALEWFLIYRNRKDLDSLAPSQANPEDCVVNAEPSGTNFFLEVRKPK